ncbi:hypothetical protein [Methylogaea oryzae]|uniref:Uncharacterized protein n=1 Tax=Methylogaea oryzae TaxID=1295382 RepID=A0A8D4VM68_9GAMM|nr:hypothetical protein [Methylogaea oryzae]BBL70146.1 hypothetical protein MoryE10_07520 [Methylogaea oryzae]
MRRIALVIFVLVCAWQGTRPKTLAKLQNTVDITRELGSELRSALVDEPIAQAKADFVKGVEKRAREEAEARAKAIDAALEKMERGETPPN